MESPIVKKSEKRLGELLRMEGLVNDEQVAAALMRQQIENELFGEAMVNLGFVTEYDVARIVSKQFSLPFIDAQTYILTRDVIESVPPVILSKYQIVPLDKIDTAMTFATCGPITDEMVNELRAITGCDVYLFVSTVSAVRQAIANFYDSLNSTSETNEEDGKLQQTTEEHTGQE